MATDTPAAIPVIEVSTSEAPTEGAPAPEVAAPVVDPPAPEVVTPSPVEATPAATGKDYAEIARKNKKLREDRTAFEAGRARLARFDAIEARVKAGERRAALEAFDVKYDELTDEILTSGQPPTADDRVAQLEAWKAEQEKQRTDAAKAADVAEAAKQAENARANVDAHINSQADKFQLVVADGAHELVWDTAMAYVAEHGLQEPIATIIEKAAATVEKHLEKRADLLGQALQKKRPAPTPTEKPTGQAASTAPTDTGGQSRTLTNRGAVDGGPMVGRDGLPLDPDLRTDALIRQRFPASA